MKIITPDNYLIRPFRANKTWNFSYTYLGNNNPSQVSVDLASQPPVDWNTFLTSSAGINSNGIFSQPLYKSVQQTFYTSSNSSGSRDILIDKGFTRNFYPSSSNFYVININQMTFGEGINEGTFLLTSPSSTASIYDDGEGHLVSSTATSSIIGNVFYGVGIAVLQQYTGSYSSNVVTDQGLFLNTGSILNVQFQGIQTIYEHEIICTIDPSEFNYSINPTIKLPTISGSLSGSVFVQTTGSIGLDLISSGTLTPYFTTVGLYNDAFQLVAIAKFPQPMRRLSSTQQSVIVRFDF